MQILGFYKKLDIEKEKQHAQPCIVENISASWSVSSRWVVEENHTSGWLILEKDS